MIRQSIPSPVYDSVIDASHTGDTNWTTALSVAGRGKAEIHTDATNHTKRELRLTIDGTLLSFGVPGYAYANRDDIFIIEWNTSILIEYRTNIHDELAYIDIAYYNR
ncbi:hypothetical protein CMI37_31025 [Candidatus Pacearchaeota archaeon]|nr:hypothetical protein [Candidatus Pacearchaeota archaeon]